MTTITEIAKNFFEACETSKGWAGSSHDDEYARLLEMSLQDHGQAIADYTQRAVLEPKLLYRLAALVPRR